MRTSITLILGLVCFCWSTSTFAQDASPERDSAVVSALAAAGPTTLLTASHLPQRGMLLKYAKGAVKQVVNNGLVLVNVASASADSRLYIKFGSDGMPQLRWRTRFGAL